MLLISIKDKYAGLIKSGQKTIELRKGTFNPSPFPQVIFVYVSSGTKTIEFYFTVKRHFFSTNITQFWDEVKDKAGVDQKDFDQYYAKSSKYLAIEIDEVIFLDQPIPISNPPQNYQYLTDDSFKQLLLDRHSHLV